VLSERRTSLSPENVDSILFLDSLYVKNGDNLGLSLSPARPFTGHSPLGLLLLRFGLV
jgi:hypothetical protein